MNAQRLEDRFLQLLDPYSPSLNYTKSCWEALQTCYTAPNRHYHTLNHIEELLAELDSAVVSLKNPDALLFSIYYHDCIYTPGRGDNEEKSALFLKQQLSNTRFTEIALCMAQIRSTKAHLPTDCKDTNLLLDLDLSILGQSIEHYNAYRQAIRKEFAHVPDMLFRKGRARFIKGMLKRGAIYQTDYFFRSYESRARANLRMELQAL
jgi:predicted metal-dependent HD superfamily phosphohydrolase